VPAATWGRAVKAASPIACQFGLVVEMAFQKVARWMASPYCVVPLLNPALWKIGELTVGATFVVPSSATPLEKTKFSGMTSVGIVEVAEPAPGLVPTMVNGYVMPW
jgi:hypothetical protein